MKKIALFLALALSPAAFASTPPEHVDQIDTAREGNLKQLVLDYYQANLKVACEESSLPKTEITKMASDSANQEKVVGTPYDYAAHYIVIQKCLYGSTFVGAYSDTVNAVIVKGSFHSKYNKKNGPAKMENLKIELVRAVDLSLPAQN